MIHCSKLLHTLAVVLILFETTLNINYFPHRPLSSPLLYVPSHPLHLPARMRCFALFLPILLPPHDARRTAVGALPIVGRFLLQLRAGPVHVEDEVARCAAQHHAWLVTHHLAQFVVLVVKSCSLRTTRASSSSTETSLSSPSLLSALMISLLGGALMG